MERQVWAFWELCFLGTDTGKNFFQFWANLMSSVYHFVFSSKKGSVESQNAFCYLMMVFWDFTPCNIMSLFRCFRGGCYLHLIFKVTEFSVGGCCNIHLRIIHHDLFVVCSWFWNDFCYIVLLECGNCHRFWKEGGKKGRKERKKGVLFTILLFLWVPHPSIPQL
jgi:hypothetical protein